MQYSVSTPEQSTK